MVSENTIDQLIDDWIAQRNFVVSLLVEHLNLEVAHDVLRPEHCGRHKIGNTGWAYRTHGIGVDVTRTNGKGGIDFDFGLTPETEFAAPDCYRILLFAQRAVHDRTIDTAKYSNIIGDVENYRPAIEVALRRRFAT